MTRPRIRIEQVHNDARREWRPTLFGAAIVVGLIIVAKVAL